MTYRRIEPVVPTALTLEARVLDDWRKRLEADDYAISVKRNQLRVSFNVMYGKKQEL